ncbi:GRAS family protein RAM1 [Linum perenne]
MEDLLEGEDLSLSLSITNRDQTYTGDRENKRPPPPAKRKRSPFSTSSSLIDVFTIGSPTRDGKIFRLLQMRDCIMNRTDLIRKSAPPTDDDDGDKGLHLIHLLLITATAIDEGNSDSALEFLAELYRNVSLVGDSVQRVVAQFADGLSARLLTRKSPFYEMIMKCPTIEEEFLAFTDLYRVSPCYQFAHFMANQSIVEAFEREEAVNGRALHIVDFEVSYGLQWPSLIQSISDRATASNRISLRVTGFGRSLDEIRETENRLVSFTKGFRNLVFEFQGLLRGSKLVNLRKRKKETIAINLVFHLNTLIDATAVSNTLKSVNALNPSVVVLVEHEGYRNSKKFLPRFMESLHYFAAMFDSLEDCLPLESPERLRIEKILLGKEIKTILNYDKEYNYESSSQNNESCGLSKVESWKGRMEGHGFGGLKLSSSTLIQAKLLLKIRAHYGPTVGGGGGGGGGFRVFQKDDGKAISLGWQDRCLLTASAWTCL